jgi:hypothetical protein
MKRWQKLGRAKIEMARPAQAKMTTRAVTLKHLAASLAEQHELTKRQGETLLNDLVGLITKHLKKGERYPNCWFWHPSGQEATGSNGAQSGNG